VLRGLVAPGVIGIMTFSLPDGIIRRIRTNLESEVAGDILRCRGEPIAIEPYHSDSSESSINNSNDLNQRESVQYFKSNQTIRFPALVSGDEVAEYETMPFETWGEIKTAELAHEMVVEVTKERIGIDHLDSQISTVPESAQSDALSIWLLLTGSNINDELGSSEVANSAPSHANVEISLEGDEFARKVPVFVQENKLGRLA